MDASAPALSCAQPTTETPRNSLQQGSKAALYGQEVVDQKHFHFLYLGLVCNGLPRIFAGIANR
jgi:hypothetical protein